MFFRGMAWHQVEQQMHPTAVHFSDELFHIRHGAVAGRDLLIILYVVARIAKGGEVAWIHPNGVEAKPLNIIELFQNPGQIADAVPIGILKGLWIDFIKKSCFKPFRQGCHKPHPF